MSDTLTFVSCINYDVKIKILFIFSFILYHPLPLSTNFVPTNCASYSLYLPPHSSLPVPTESPSCDLHLSGSVPVLVVCLVFYFCFLGTVVDSYEFVVILLFMVFDFLPFLR